MQQHNCLMWAKHGHLSCPMDSVYTADPAFAEIAEQGKPTVALCYSHSLKNPITGSQQSSEHQHMTQFRVEGVYTVRWVERSQ